MSVARSDTSSHIAVLTTQGKSLCKLIVEPLISSATQHASTVWLGSTAGRILVLDTAQYTIRREIALPTQQQVNCLVSTGNVVWVGQGSSMLAVDADGAITRTVEEATRHTETFSLRRYDNFVFSFHGDDKIICWDKNNAQVIHTISIAEAEANKEASTTQQDSQQTPAQNIPQNSPQRTEGVTPSPTQDTSQSPCTSTVPAQAPISESPQTRPSSSPSSISVLPSSPPATSSIDQAAFRMSRPGLLVVENAGLARTNPLSIWVISQDRSSVCVWR